MIETKSALKIIYYISAADGHIDDVEIEEYKKIATTVATDYSLDEVEKLIAECNEKVPKVDEEDYFDILQEVIDDEMKNQSDENGLSVRALVWDLLVIAAADEDYSESERRVIKHICRRQNLDSSVLMEFELLIKTANALQNEHAVIEKSNRSYGEIRPIIENIESKQQMIIQNVQDLIADEDVMNFTEKLEHKKDIFDKAGEKISEVSKPVIDKVGETAKPVIEKVADNAKPVADKAMEGVQKAKKNVIGKLSELLQRAENKLDGGDK